MTKSSSEDTLRKILEQLEMLNSNLSDNVYDQTAQMSLLVKSLDWKLWATMNAVCDALVAQGLLKEDPRLPKS